MSRYDRQFHDPPPVVKQDNAVVLHTRTGERIFDVVRHGATLVIDGVELAAESVERLQRIASEALAWKMQTHEA